MVVNLLQPNRNPTLADTPAKDICLIQGSIQHLEDAAELDLVSPEDAGPVVGDILLRTIRIANALNLDLLGCLTLARIQ
jgi:hypothetical protein